MNLTLISALVSAAVAGLIGWSAAWTLQGRTIDELKLGAANDRIEQQRAIRQAIERASQDVRKAQESASHRNADLRRDASRANDVAGGLRIATTAATRASTESDDACRAIVRTYDQLFSEGSDILREIAATADQCISDNKALADGWPR